MMKTMEVDTVVDMMGDLVKKILFYILYVAGGFTSRNNFPETNIDIIVPENQRY